MARGRPRKNAPAITGVDQNVLKCAASSAPSTPLRQSKRVKSASDTSTMNVTPKKSTYFDHPSGSESAQESPAEKEESGYDDEDASVAETEDDVEEEDEESEEYDSVEPASHKRKRSRLGSSTKPPSSAAKPKKGEELWRVGVRSNLEPGQEIFVKLPKARQAGSTPYTDSTIHPNTLLFLGDLKKNNERAWLKVHDADYRQSLKDWNSFVECLTEKLIEADETIPELPPKDLTFRIYRDIRFSPDPTPFKTYFSAAWSRTGRKGPYAHYYVQIAPGKSIVGGGIWCPESEPMGKLRRAIDRKSARWKTVLQNDGIRKEYLSGCKAEDKAVVKAFIKHNEENMLKRKPNVGKASQIRSTC